MKLFLAVSILHTIHIFWWCYVLCLLVDWRAKHLWETFGRHLGFILGAATPLMIMMHGVQGGRRWAGGSVPHTARNLRAGQRLSVPTFGRAGGGLEVGWRFGPPTCEEPSAGPEVECPHWVAHWVFKEIELQVQFKFSSKPQSAQLIIQVHYKLFKYQQVTSKRWKSHRNLIVHDK